MLCLINISIFALSVDKQAHWLQIMFPAVLNTRSLGTLVDGVANRQRACLPKFGKLCSLAFHHSSGHLITYSCVAYLNTLPAGLCFKPLEYILITIFKEKNNYVCCLCDSIPLHCFRDQIYFKYMAWVGCISVANHNWSYEPSWNENCQIEKQRNC